MNRILYLGLDPSRYHHEGTLVHYPIIRTVPFPFSPEIERIFKNWPLFTHLIFTSRTAAALTQEHLARSGFFGDIFSEKKVLAIGKATASALYKVDAIADEETAEGMVILLKSIPKLAQAHLFFPRSELSRPVISRYLLEQNISFTECPLYTTLPHKREPLPELKRFDEIVFTSPSTVKAFVTFYGHLPSDKKLTALGPITERALQHYNKA